METLGRYPLSVILSFLHEDDGTCLLLTKKRYATQLLPLFRVKQHDDDDGVLSIVPAADQEGTSDQRRPPKHRHTFVVCPVQDPTVLLARLNTRKLYRRKQRPHDWIGYTTTERAHKEWDHYQQQQHPPEFPFPADQMLLRFQSSKHQHTNDFFHRGITLLASYPRSGNSLARSLLERTTGLVTGSDTRPDRSLSRELAELHHLVGEGVVNYQTAVVKTHWPERQGNVPVTAQRAILLVRNPYDAMDSYWNLMATKSHVKTLTEDVYERFRDKFEGLVENEIGIWNRFNRYWLEEVDIPVLLVRFEDLIQDPARELSRMIAFTLGVDQLSPFWQSRIVHVTGASVVDQLGSYQPRPTGGHPVTVGKSIRKGRYSERLLNVIHNASEPTTTDCNLLEKLGFDVISGGFSDCQQYVPTHTIFRADSLSRLTVNEGLLIRPLSCPFGRALTAWRQSVTDNDTIPLPTVHR